MLEKIKKIIENSTGLDNLDLTESTSLKDDLELDSFEIAQLICSIEDELGVDIPDYELKRIDTLGDLVECIESR
ncbi:MAG: acyl carrier protein [Acutalibacteraceae bacterium]